MITKTETTYEARLYIGSREGEGGPPFPQEELRRRLAEFQAGRDDTMPIRITPTQFVHEDYWEDGWELGAINFPRWPKTGDEIRTFMLDLGAHLLTALHQSRVTVVLPGETVMYQAEGAGD